MTAGPEALAYVLCLEPKEKTDNLYFSFLILETSDVSESSVSQAQSYDPVWNKHREMKDMTPK